MLSERAKRAITSAAKGMIRQFGDDMICSPEELIQGTIDHPDGPRESERLLRGELIRNKAEAIALVASILEEYEDAE